MPMKLSRFLLLFSILILQPVLILAAEDIPISKSAGAGELSVPIEGDGGTCPPTSYGHGVENPCSSLEIKGPDVPSNKSKYEVIGGVGVFTWTVTGATIEKTGPRTAELTVDGACGSGTITVSDSCGSTTKDVRFPVGQWVQIGFTRFGNDSFTFWNMKFYEGVEIKVEILGSTRCWYDWCENTQDLESKGYVPVSEIDSPFLYPRHPEFGAFCEGNPSFNGGVSTDYCTGTRIFYASKETVYAWKCP